MIDPKNAADFVVAVILIVIVVAVWWLMYTDWL